MHSDNVKIYQNISLAYNCAFYTVCAPVWRVEEDMAGRQWRHTLVIEFIDVSAIIQQTIYDFFMPVHLKGCA